ncbi:MAG: MmgE/PrpD family protein [Hyphomicrobiales bacterium]
MSAELSHAPIENGDAVSSSVTKDAAQFISDLRFKAIPHDAVAIGLRCIADGVGLYAAGLTEASTRIVSDLARHEGGREEALLLGGGALRVPMRAAARTLGISAHAHDFDDTQVSKDPRHIYGLLTHPTTAPLTAALVVADALGDVSGEDFLTAFLGGFEVSCKVSEWMKPDHYLRGHHSSGTVATFGAAMAAGKLLNLDEERLTHTLGIAASMAAGIRCSFGTMCKPWHVGRACENGVVAALMAQQGFDGDPTALDGRWGFAEVMAGGYAQEKLSQGFGNIWSIIEPGVSIKPYPSGILTHQAMDMVLGLVTSADVPANDVASITFAAGDNILNPIRYDVAQDALQAKFSMAALISMLVLYRKAGLEQFDDAVIRHPDFQAMQHKITCVRDAKINALGFDEIRSHVCITMNDGTQHTAVSDPRYRGGPDLPFTDAKVREKMLACLQSAKVSADVQGRLVSALDCLPNKGPSELLDAMRLVPESGTYAA